MKGYRSVLPTFFFTEMQFFLTSNKLTLWDWTSSESGLEVEHSTHSDSHEVCAPG